MSPAYSQWMLMRPATHTRTHTQSWRTRKAAYEQVLELLTDTGNTHSVAEYGTTASFHTS